jgi:hypothetical protein
MKPLNNLEINEIAQQFDCGFDCFWNIRNNSLLFIPDENANSGVEMEFWEEELEALENDFDSYVKIPKPESFDNFKIMEAFVNSNIPDENFKKELEITLRESKPFKNFKHLIDNSKVREEWFEFKNKSLENWVRNQIEEILEVRKKS